MNNPVLKKFLPHIAALVIMTLVTFLFFAPIVFGGKALPQGDNQKADAMQTEILKFKKETGKAPLWTNSIFSGMPAFQIYQEIKGNFTEPIFDAALLWHKVTDPHTAILLAMICTYLLMIVLGVDWRLAVAGAIVFGLSNYYIDITIAGHSTKMVALAYTPAIYAAAVLAFRGRYLLGGGLMALFVALQIYANHFQISYYTFILVGILAIIELIRLLKAGNVISFAKAAGALAIGFGLGILSNTSKLWPTFEYQSETIRGHSDLKSKELKGSGLDKDYAFGWSYGIDESLTLLIPNYKGGGASQTYKGSKTYDLVYSNISQAGYPPEQLDRISNQQTGSMMYWGDQPFVGVAIYFGVILILLCVMGIFIVPGEIKHWLWISALFSLTIAWGGNFFFNDILFDYFPMYNKFRAVSMALGLSQLSIGILAMMGLQQMFDPQTPEAAKRKALTYSVGIVGGLCLLVMLFSYGMEFKGANDEKFKQIIDIIRQDRGSLLRADALRSLGLIALTGAVLFAYLRGMMRPVVAAIAVSFILVADVLLVDSRIFGSSNYVTKSEAAAPVQETGADKLISQDTDPHYRVLDLSNGNPYTNALTSFFHNSLGGYHAAKLMRYQEMIDKYLSDPSKNMHLIGMLNAKYLLLPGKDNTPPQAQKNPMALGNAWFVKNVQLVDNADAELESLGALKPAETLVVQKQYAGSFNGLNIQYDSTNTIKLTKYNPDKMEYEYSAKTDQVAVFSEVYYPAEKGWNMYLNGKPYQPFVKANYILRAIRLPAGQNQKLEMRFEPRSYYLGETISMGASAALLLMLIGSLFLFFRTAEMPEASHLPQGAPARVAAPKAKAGQLPKKKK